MRQLAEISGRNKEEYGLAFPCVTEKYDLRFESPALRSLSAAVLYISGFASIHSVCLE